MELEPNAKEEEEKICKDVPNLLSSFVDTFVDFAVSGGLFLLPPNSPSYDSPNAPTQPIQTHYPEPDRLVAIGDVHGDLQKTKQAMRLAGLIDASDNWSGGSTTVVQVGDVLDRGGEEIKILYFLEKLKREAARKGGNFITMNGNHEIMNVERDFRYVTKLGLEEFKDWAFWYSLGEKMKGLCVGLEKGKDIFYGIPLTFCGVKNDFFSGFRARIAALKPNGPIAERFLTKNATVLVIGDSVFVHGGLLREHVEYGLERINEEVKDWISGVNGRRLPPDYCKGSNAVVWLRKFSDEVAKNCDCSALEHVLATIPGAKRMIMGHTIQEAGINGVCGGRAIRIDVGMSKGCINGLPEVLEISRNSGLQIMTSNPLYQNKYEAYVDSGRKEGLGLLIPEDGPRQVQAKA